MSKKKPRPPLRVLLVRAGVASKRDVKKAVAEARKSGERLIDVVVRKGWGTDELIAQLLAERWRLPFANAGELSLDPAAIALIPHEECRGLDALPVGFAGRRPLVAIADPRRQRFAAVRERIGDASYLVVARSVLDSLLSGPLPAGEALTTETVAEQPVDAGEPSSFDDARASVGHGTIADATLESLEIVADGLQDVFGQVVAMGKSLALAREQLHEQEAELEAAEAAREQDGETISRLESELSHQRDRLEAMSDQVARLKKTVDRRGEIR